MKTKTACSLVLAVTPTWLAAPASAQLQQATYGITLSVPVPSGPVSVTLPAFDPALGILRSATILVDSSVTGSLAFENTNPTSTVAPHYSVAAWIAGTHPAGPFPSPANPAYEFAPSPFNPVALGAFDGTLDFAGASAVTLPFQDALGTGSPYMNYPVFHDAGLQAFVNPMSMPTSLPCTISVTDISGGSLPQGILESHVLTATINFGVRYDYEILPAAICVAVVLSGCPCSNHGTNGGGCANSVNAQGGLLVQSGNASLANDTLILSGSRMPDSSALYFQGTSHAYAQTPFGDGLRCVFGSIARLGTKTNVGGASAYPGVGDASISVRGGVTAPGTTRYYQTFYRNSAAFCTSATFNTTNGRAVFWSP